MLDYRVDTFLKVCETMNYTRAADALGLSQPAVSQHIAFLESYYGAPLFTYSKKKLALTPAGHLLRERLGVLAGDMRTLVEEVGEASAAKSSLNLGLTMTVGEYVALDSIAAWRRHYPMSEIHLFYGNTERLLALIAEGKISLALVEGYYPKNAYDALPYATDRFIAVCAADHRFASGSPHTLRDLMAEGLVLREHGSGTRDILERQLLSRGMKIEDFGPTIEVENMHALIDLLERDCGISFLYSVAAQEGLRSGRLREIPLEDFSLVRHFDFIWSRKSLYAAQMCQTAAHLIAFRENKA